LNDNRLLLAGAVPSALMALVADFGFGLIEKRFAEGASRKGASLRTLALAALLLGALIMGYATWRSWQRRSHSAVAHVTVGSKDFTESILLAEIVAQMLEAKNIEVDRKFDLGGNLAHSALVGGQIDLYPEYTGTSFTAILHHQPITDPAAVYNQVKREYDSQFNLAVSAPLGFDNTFAMLVRGEDARRFKLKTISEAARYAPRWQAGFGHDFVVRPDGYPGFSKTYRIQFAGVNEMSLDLTYQALASHQVDMIAGNSTDGRIAALDLIQLEDDRHYFPPYEGVFLTRKDTLGRVNMLGEILQKLGGALPTEEMRKLNYEVDGAKRDKKNVVREWLVKKGFIQ
jgi:osmoprotectant transport system permease protein